jgi:DNA-binding HxlR family transcriptional regulator
MKSYGQYCPVARAAQILGQRWTLLVLRDLLGGTRRFNDLRRGVPLMSPSLLSRRLKELETCGLVKRIRKEGSRGAEYVPTPAALELRPVVNLLGAWGQRWLPAQLVEEELDVSLLMWDVSHRVDPEQFGPGRTVIAFEYTDRPRLKKGDWWLDKWWLVMTKGESDLCVQDPGFDADLFIVTDLATMTAVWMNHVPARDAVKSGAIQLHGSRPLADSFHRWLPLSVHARHPRPPEPLDLDNLLAISRAEISE